jgi:type IV secretory pathway protease TraF
MPLAVVNHGKRRVRLTIENRRVPEFGGWLIVQLPEIYASFSAPRGYVNDKPQLMKKP